LIDLGVGVLANLGHSGIFKLDEVSITLCATHVPNRANGFRIDHHLVRSFSILSLAFIVAASVAQGQYFPKLALDSHPRGDEFKQAWYSGELRALREPSLLPLTKIPSKECYRFLWLRTFNHPIAIRFTPKSDGTSVLIVKVANGWAGFHPGVLSENSSVILTREQTQGFLTLLDKVDFWHVVNPVDDQTGTDGSQWIIEGVKGGRFHVVDRWTPRNGPVRELGLMLAFDLAHLNIPKNEVY
jgi:hypothetical protein